MKHSQPFEKLKEVQADKQSQLFCTIFNLILSHTDILKTLTSNY